MEGGDVPTIHGFYTGNLVWRRLDCRVLNCRNRAMSRKSDVVSCRVHRKICSLQRYHHGQQILGQWPCYSSSSLTYASSSLVSGSPGAAFCSLLVTIMVCWRLDIDRKTEVAVRRHDLNSMCSGFTNIVVHSLYWSLLLERSGR